MIQQTLLTKENDVPIKVDSQIEIDHSNTSRTLENTY